MSIKQTIITSLKDSASNFSNATIVRKHRPDYKIILYMGLLMMIGLIVIYAIGPQRANVLNYAYGSEYSETYFFVKQTFSLLFAVVGFLVMAFVPYQFFTRHAGKFVVGALVLCLLLAISSWMHLEIAPQVLGAARWFNLGQLGSVQPSEILKFAILLFLAGFLGNKMKQKMQNDYNNTMVPIAVLVGLSLLFIVVIQKDLGTGISLLGIVSAIMFMSDISKANLIRIFLLLVAIGAVFVLSSPHRMERVVTYLKGDDTSTSDENSYHIEHAKQAIGAGGLLGVGIGNSIQATGYLPEAINDSVFAIMGETFGFLGLATILTLFTLLLTRILKVMDHLVDNRLKLLVAGVFGWLTSHVVLNIASMIGVFPLTGITLPLLSFGGTSMLFTTAALGLVFQLSRYTIHPSKLKEALNENIDSRRGIRRSRYAGRRSFARN